MKLTNIAMATAAASLAAAPIAASAATAERANAPVEDASALGGDSTIGNSLIIVAIAAVGMAILLLTDDDDDVDDVDDADLLSCPASMVLSQASLHMQQDGQHQHHLVQPLHAYQSKEIIVGHHLQRQICNQLQDQRQD